MHLPLVGFLDAGLVVDVFDIEVDGHDTICSDESGDLLVHMAERMINGGQLLHMAAYAGGAKQLSIDATRDDLRTWRLGQKLAARLDIHCYLGAR
eukprot:8782399-Alexandrium_andersonii.AAC.1